MTISQSTVAGPRLSRSVTLRFLGDWGMANMHAICGWLSQMMGDRTGPHSRFAIWNGRGGADAMRAVGRGDVDVALTTPASFARMALDGRGLYRGESFPHLRALACIPQWDHLVLAVDAALGLSSFDDIRKGKPSLAIATSPDDGVNLIGYAVQRVMEAAGIPDSILQAWGGRYVLAERPNDCIAMVSQGYANAIFHEAIMTTWWQDLANSRELTFIPIEPAVLHELDSKYDWPRNELPSGYFRGLHAPLATLDFSDFLVVVRNDMPDDIAYLLTWCVCETRGVFEQRYIHIPRERSPISYPLDPQRMRQTPLRLHAGAERYYDEAGIRSGGSDGVA